jgi:alpha-L-rhamnosidase
VRHRLITALLAVVAVAFARGTCAQTPALKVTNLRCEYLVDPLAIDVPKPRLSWELLPEDPAARGLDQTAYAITVAPLGTVPGAAKLLWTSGKVASSSTCQVEYDGPALKPGQQVMWYVEVWDNKGGGPATSPQATWAAGLPNKRDWSPAEWIGDGTAAPDATSPLPAPMLRKTFASAKRPARAVVYVTALGLYDLWLNGEHLGNHCLAPEWTDYKQRVQYQAYDVTTLINEGDNCIGAILGDGWYAGKVGLAGIVPNGPRRAIYGRYPRLLLRLELQYADQSRMTVVTDGTWQTTLDGPIRADDLLDGETYDARKELPGWCTAGFDAKGWTPAATMPAPDIAIVTQPNEPIRVTRELRTAALTEPKPNVYVFDLGQNMVGRCRLRLTAKPGATVTIRHAEVLNPDGTLYTTNLRGAAQTDRYTFRSDKEETYEPRFTYHGFRYVELSGLESKPSLDAATGRVANSAAPEVGTFECSDPMVNRLWQNILWTQRGNLMSVPTDCPQRDERCGWMGDILAFAPTACFNMDMAAFFTKWIPDTRDAQAKDGRFADFSPQPYDSNARFSGVPAWGDAGVFVPWTAYEYYGDSRILAGQYAAAVRWVEYIKSKNPDLLWKNSRGNDYGDWLNADTLKLQGWPAKGAEVPKDVFATMYFYCSTELVSEMAQALGKPDDQAKYASLARDIRDAFNIAYVDPEGQMAGDTQAGYALALHFGLLPNAVQSAATSRMIDRFKPYDGQISTGFHSTLPLMTELSSRGHNDEAYRLLLNRKMPSWGYEVDHGATTVWERWDGWVEGRGFQDPGMNSFAHYAIGSVGQWLYETMLGIRPEAPGFARVRIQPRPGPGIMWAKGSYHSIRGEISSGWEENNGQLHLRVTIPPNVKSMVMLPTREAKTVKLDGKPLTEYPEIKYQANGSRGTWCEIGSGSYEFVVAE